MITYVTNFGLGRPVHAYVESITRSERKRDKNGEPTEICPIERIDYHTFTLSNGYWCYGEQIVLNSVAEMVGDLYFLDANKQQRTPSNLYFLEGPCRPDIDEQTALENKGLAVTHYDNALRPVYLCRNGGRIKRPQWAGLSAEFRSGYILDLHVE